MRREDEELERNLARRKETLARVTVDGRALRYASEGLKGDREVVMAAVAQSGAALKYASSVLRRNREVVLAAVASPVGDGGSGEALYHASPELRGDAAFVALAAEMAAKKSAELAASVALTDSGRREEAGERRGGLVLRYASEPVRDNKEAVLACVRCSWKAFAFASPRLRADREVALSALRQHAAASAWLLGLGGGVGGAACDVEVALACVGARGFRGRMLATFDEATVRGDRRVVNAAVARDSRALAFASEALRRDPAAVDLAMVSAGLRAPPLEDSED